MALARPLRIIPMSFYHVLMPASWIAELLVTALVATFVRSIASTTAHISTWHLFRWSKNLLPIDVDIKRHALRKRLLTVWTYMIPVIIISQIVVSRQERRGGCILELQVASFNVPLDKMPLCCITAEVCPRASLGDAIDASKFCLVIWTVYNLCVVFPFILVACYSGSMLSHRDRKAGRVWARKIV